MQRLVYLALKPTHYKVMDIKEINERLEKAGISDGGQLVVIDPVKLGKDLGVQGLMFGNVSSFDYTNIGFFTQRKVGLELKLVDTKTGATLWENEATTANRQVALDKEQAKRNFAKGLADQWVDKIAHAPLEEEARLTTIKALKTLPGFVFCGFAVDDQTVSPLQRGTKGFFKEIIRTRKQ